MTQTIDQRERERFEAWWKDTMNTEVMDLSRTEFGGTSYDKQAYACHETNRSWMAWQAALTKALTRIEELEGAQPKDGEDGYTREPYPAEEAMNDAWSGILSAHHISPPLMMAMSIAMGDMISLINELRHYDLRRAALTQGITE